MSREIKFAPGTPKEFKTAIEHLVEQNGVAAENLDGVLDLQKDGEISKEEFIHFVYNSPDWQKYLHALDKAGLRHPLDIHKIPPKILERIKQLKEKVHSEINFKPEDAGYCDVFVPKFYEEGLPAFAEGGLGFSAPFNYRGIEANEMTASEAYKAVLHPNSRRFEFGSCTEATYKIMSAFLAAGVPCEIGAIATQNHQFARYKNYDLDPAEIGKIGWEEVLDHKKLAATFYEQVIKDEKQADIILAIDPEGLGKGSRKLIDAIVDGNETAIFEAAQVIVSKKPRDIGQLIKLYLTLNLIPDSNTRKNVFSKLLSAFPDNPYVVWVVAAFCARNQCLQAEGDSQNVNNPSSGNAEYLWALEKQRQGDFKKFEELLEEALIKNPNHALALQLKASLLLQRGEVSSAEQLIQKAIKRAPNLPMNNALLSSIAMIRGDNDKAYEFAKKETLVFVGNEPSQIALGNAALSARKYFDAYVIGAFYVHQHSKDPSGYLLMARASQAMGRLGEAQTIAKQALKLADNPYSKADALNCLSQLSAIKGDFEGALDLARQAATLSPQSAMFFDFMSIQGLLFDGRWEEAKEASASLKKRYPEIGDAYAMAASVEFLIGQTKKAEQDVEKALQLNPNSLLAFMTQLQLHHEKEAWEKATALMEKMNQSFKRDPSLPSLNAYHYLVTKKYDLVKKEGAKTLKLNPYDFGSKGVLGLVAVEERDFKKAEKLAKEIEKLNPANAMPPFIRAKVYLAQKKWTQAEKEARKSLEKYPYDKGLLPFLSSYHVLIAALEAQGKTEEAKAAQEAMLKNREE